MLTGRKWVRAVPGAIVKDVPRVVRALARSGTGFRSDAKGWISLCNRNERLLATDTPGVTCDWEDGSNLHIADVLPIVGKRIMAAALREWPVEFRQVPRIESAEPAISFIFTHAGDDRLDQLCRVLETVAAQHVACECIVVDQSPASIRDRLPAHVSYHHLDKSRVAPGWHKAWGYNVGARLAKAELLVFQDGDVCVPERYASELIRAFADDRIGAVSLQRFLFYLDGDASAAFGRQPNAPRPKAPERVRQNWKGGTIAIRKAAILAMGGFDEGFVDWGGEDDEFFDRCAEVGHCRSGYLPFVHLWHAAQPERKSSANPNISDVLPWRLAMPRAQRIEELNRRNWGNPGLPAPTQSYKVQRPST